MGGHIGLGEADRIRRRGGRQVRTRRFREGDTIVVGAPGNESGDGAGAAYVFTKPDTGWVETSNR